MEFSFTKLHGNGNDFILIDEYEKEVIPDDFKAEFAAQYCDRRFGIGGDGVLYLSKSTKADIKMRLFQPDRSEAEMCGNGIRCLVKYASDKRYVRDACKVETLAGIISVRMGERDNTFLAAVDMPSPRYQRREIPATGDGEYVESIDGFIVYAVNIGVPHAVTIVDDVERINIEEVGPKIRYHTTFLNGANANFVQRISDNAIKIRTYERGVEAETMSCGSGAAASAVILFRLKMIGEIVTVETVGGPLTLHMKEGLVMEGPAETVFQGIVTF